MQDLRVAILPELELIQSRISGPCKELQGVMKIIRKNITKRDHKVGGTPFPSFLSRLQVARLYLDLSFLARGLRSVQ